MSAVCCWLFGVGCVMATDSCSSCVVRCLSCCSLFAGGWLLSAVCCCLKRVVGWSLFVVCCRSVLVVRYLVFSVFAVGCLPHAASYML